MIGKDRHMTFLVKSTTGNRQAISRSILYPRQSVQQVPVLPYYSGTSILLPFDDGRRRLKISIFIHTVAITVIIGMNS